MRFLTVRNLIRFSRRSLKILAESYAIKGLSLENQGLKGTSKFKQAERETEMVGGWNLEFGTVTVMCTFYFNS